MAAKARLQRNDNFFRQGKGAVDAETKVRRAFQRCAECGVLNLSSQNLSGDLPETVCGFQDASWAENWWEQCPVVKIDVSHNTLVRIPRDIGNLADCTNFVAVSNKLESLPDELFTNLQLKQLNLRQNSLQTLPAEACAHADQLVELVLTENNLVGLPSEVLGLQSLEVLEVASNKLASLPDKWACTHLKRLDLSRNCLGPALPPGLKQCGMLRELNLAGNNLQNIVDYFSLGPNAGWRRSLVLLDLSGNRIGPSFCAAGFEAIDTLNIAFNKIRNLELTGPFPQISTVIAEGNQIAEFPAALLPSSAPKLSTLDFANNDLPAVPPELGLNQGLRRIALAGNPLRSIRPELLRGNAENLKKFLRSRIEGAASEEVAMASEAAREDMHADLRAAAANQELSLEGRNLAQLPALPAGLRTLRISRNMLSAAALADALCLSGEDDFTAGEEAPPCQTVQALVAARNALGGPSGTGELLPCLLRRMPELKELDLSFNQLTSAGSASWGWVPRAGGRLLLQFADLGGNSFTVFPWELLVACPTLNELRLRQNNISSLHDLAEVKESRLCTLDMEENRLTQLPAWLPSVLPNLRTLMVANNDIGPTLPPELGFWSSLQAVSLAGNPLRGIRQALLAKGWPSIAAWLQDKLPEGAPQVVPALVAHQAVNTPTPAVPQLPASRGIVSERGQSAFDRQPSASALSRPSPPGSSRGGCSTSSSAAPPPAMSTPGSTSSYSDERLARLRVDVAALEDELNAPGISRARKSAVTHSLRMKRSELLKAERELKRAAAVNDHLEGG